MITKIENYYLNQPIEEVLNLKEYTAEEYQMFKNAGWVKMLEDEKIFNGKETNFNGNLWDTVLGATKGKIYKISLQIMDTDKNHIENVFKSTLDYMTKEMGKYNEHPVSSKKYYWDTPEGSIIYEQKNIFDQYCINIFITSNSIREQAKESLINFFSKTILFKANQIFGWNPLVHNDEENLRWSWLRAVEWGIWPAFLSGPIVPLLLPFFEWWQVIGIVAVLTVIWSFIRYKYINLSLAKFGIYFVLLKWITCPLAAIYLIVQHNYILALLSLLWPILAASFGIFVGGTQIGKIQKMFMAEFGYSEKNK